MNATETTNGRMTDDGEQRDIIDEFIQNAGDSPAMDRRESALIGMQLSVAATRVRSLDGFFKMAEAMATRNVEVAASCSFALPRSGKTIAGISVRLAEICAMAWGNIHTEARIVEIGDEFIKVAGTCWDMQSNNRCGQEVMRRITDKNGRRYNHDMIMVTANAAMSLAIRNAILRVIPRSFVEEVRLKCQQVVRGDAKSLDARRAALIKHFADLGISEQQICAAVGKRGIPDIDLDDLLTLRGYATAISEGHSTAEELFAPSGSTTTPAPLPKAPGKIPAKRKQENETPPPANPTPGQFVRATEAQLDEIDATLAFSGLSPKEAFAGLVDTLGNPITVYVQLSTEQASEVLRRISEGCERQKAKDA